MKHLTLDYAERHELKLDEIDFEYMNSGFKSLTKIKNYDNLLIKRVGKYYEVLKGYEILATCEDKNEAINFIDNHDSKFEC